MRRDIWSVLIAVIPGVLLVILGLALLALGIAELIQHQL